ncbi:hypothetical protein TRVA0_002S00452 [Trichomonascus vanleenenianus]|uniref:Pbp1p n=1 Tax=Trichomonascus vanleenenianus TaxID=2268995 RepID=UPI003EC95277
MKSSSRNNTPSKQQQPQQPQQQQPQSQNRTSQGSTTSGSKRVSDRRPAQNKTATPPPNAWHVKPNAASEADSNKAHMHDRLNFLFGKSVGQFAVVTVANGARFRGVLAGVTTDNDLGVVLKCAVKYAQAPGEEDEEDRASYATLAIPPKELADVLIEAPDLTPDDTALDAAATPSGARAQSAGGFKTDTDISASGKGGYVERELQRWAPEEGELHGSLEDLSSRGSHGAWDQFAVNREKFGVESTYHEHYYTTAINKSAPNYRELEKKAEKLAAEIEGSGYSGNIHIAEERGIKVDDSGLDEEDKYSGVARKPQPPSSSSSSTANKYTPPQFRPPSGDRTAGVPYDPAIISSSLVTPDGRLTAPKAVAPAAPLPAVKTESSSDKVKAQPQIHSALPPSVKKLPLGKDVKGPSKIGAGGIEKELAGNFRQFVSTEYERLNMKKQYIQNKQKSERLQDFKKFSEDYKIKAPLPPDLIPILAKGKEKQEEIRQKSAANSPEVRKAVSSPVVKTPPVKSPTAKAEATKTPPVKPEATKSPAVKPESTKPSPVKPEVTKKKTESPVVPSPTAGTSVGTPTPPSTASTTSTAKKPMKFNFNVPQFKPNPSAHSFTPGGGSFGGPQVTSPKPFVSPHAKPAASHVRSPQQPKKEPHPQAAHSPAIPPAAQHSRSASPNVFVERSEARSRAGKFNPFLQGKREFEARHPDKTYIIERAFVQGPTWPPGPSDRGYLSLFASPDAIPRGFGPSPQAGGMAFPAMPMMQPGFEDPNLRPMMATSPPPPPGQMVPGFIPNAMGYPQYMPQYAPQYFRPAQGANGTFMASPQMMGQAFPAMTYVPQAPYSPRAQNAMVPPPVPQGYYSPQQRTSNDASHQGSPSE